MEVLTDENRRKGVRKKRRKWDGEKWPLARLLFSLSSSHFLLSFFCVFNNTFADMSGLDGELWWYLHAKCFCGLVQCWLIFSTLVIIRSPKITVSSNGCDSCCFYFYRCNGPRNFTESRTPELYSFIAKRTFRAMQVVPDGLRPLELFESRRCKYRNPLGFG